MQALAPRKAGVTLAGNPNMLTDSARPGPLEVALCETPSQG
jgi:hypothetical protein